MRLAAAVGLAIVGADLVTRVVGAPLAVLEAAVGALVAWVMVGLAIARFANTAVWAIRTTVLGGAMLAGSAGALGNAGLVLALDAWGMGHWRDAVPVLGAPVVEEVTKVAGLAAVALGRAGVVASPVAAALHGGFVGIGFAFAENLEFFTFAAIQGGLAGMLASVYVRAVLGGLAHALFTATAALALVPSVRWSWAIPMLSVGVLEHVAWNGGASPAIVAAMCDAPATGGACRPVPSVGALMAWAPLTAITVLGPAALLLGWFLRTSGRR